MMRNYFFAFIVFALLIAACHPLVSTFTPTLTPLVTATPSATLAPTTTPTRPPPTSTVVFVKITPTPTESPLDIAGQVLTELRIDTETKYSPDRGIKEWQRLMAFPTTESAGRKYGSQFFTYLTVKNYQPVEKTWVLVDKWQEWGFGYPIPELLGWSADNQSLYFYDAHIPDGCQPLGGFQADLRRVDLATGAIQPIPISWTGGMALSPDTTKMIYYDYPTVEVGIYDTVAHRQQRIPFELSAGLESWYAGDFTWSPDGQSALFVIEYGDACFPTGASLRWIDPRTSAVTTLIEREKQFLSILSWTEPNKVLVSIDDVQQVLDPLTGKLSTP
jgi:WD40-like Beta Propeller Repeat